MTVFSCIDRYCKDSDKTTDFRYFMVKHYREKPRVILENLVVENGILTNPQRETVEILASILTDASKVSPGDQK